jgi:hydrogenase maturation factor
VKQIILQKSHSSLSDLFRGNTTLCITRVGKIISLNESKSATIRLLGDNKMVEDVDVSMIKAKLNNFVEVYANLALRKLSQTEAEERRQAWVEITRSRN